ncbi:hypothetical protein [Herbaspirillum chlorophenolicum]|uniref:hypothetical protein n=1 Tax=Herbaspirillum chlorophenolicum TaxID=211589 RepID=UPI00067D27E5|nr:hypothetical protein [Herbaspirillum chlorophenolicum]
MNYSALIDWRAGVRASSPAPRPVVARLKRRLRSLLMFVLFWLSAGVLLASGFMVTLYTVQALGQPRAASAPTAAPASQDWKDL